jgi:ATP-dependent Clp protease ATP-binding subunit ClpA
VKLSEESELIELGMFDKFSGPARRVVFWARRDAGRSGAETIQPEHLLAGWLAEDQHDWAQTASSATPFVSSENAKAIRQMLVERTTPGVPKPDTVDMLLAERSRQVLIAADQRAGGSMITLLHLLWGLLSDEGSPASSLLRSKGITMEQVDEAIRKGL